MKTAIFGLLFLVLVACAVSANTDYKCSPPQVWEGKMQQSFFKNRQFIPYQRLSYDGDNRRTRTLQVVQNGTEKTTYDILYYQRCRTMFIYNLDTKECKRIKTDYPWQPMEIPEEATYVGDGYAGSAGVPQGGLLVQTWSGHRSEQGGFDYMFTLTRHGCIPMSYTMWGKDLGLINANFYDIVLGIDDPNVFRPRQACYEQGQVLPEDLQHINAQVAAQHIRPRTANQPTKNMSKLYRLLRQENEVV